MMFFFNRFDPYISCDVTFYAERGQIHNLTLRVLSKNSP